MARFPGRARATGPRLDLAAHAFQAERMRVITVPGAQARNRCGASPAWARGARAPPRCGTRRRAPNACPPAAMSWPRICRPTAATQFALGWLLGGYRFTRYRSQPKPAHAVSLVTPAECDANYAQAAASAHRLGARSGQHAGQRARSGRTGGGRRRTGPGICGPVHAHRGRGAATRVSAGARGRAGQCARAAADRLPMAARRAHRA